MNNNTPKIALGTWSWGVGAVGGDQVFGNHLGEAELRPVFDAAMKAVVYGMGASEDILGTFAKTYSRKDVLLSTKFTPDIAGESENPVEEMCNSSLKRLGTDFIDLYWIHNPGDVEKWTPGLIPLVKSGKVKRVGVSNHNLEQIKRAEEILYAEGVHLSAVQNHYSLLYRSSEDAGILDYCKEKGIEFFSYMVLEQGALSGKYDVAHPLPEGSMRAATYNPLLPRIERLTTVMKEIAQAHQVASAQIPVAWAIAKGTTPIIGVTGPKQVEDAVKAVNVALNAKEMAELEQAAAQTGVDTRGSWENPMV